MKIVPTDTGFEIRRGDLLLIAHSAAEPCCVIGAGDPDIAMNRSNFAIADRVTSRRSLAHAEIDRRRIRLAEAPGGPVLLDMEVGEGGIDIRCHDPAANRFWIDVVAELGEYVWGGGEQLSYLNMRGRRFPLWTSEPGVGRDKSTELTRRMDALGNAGGDYWTTNYPQPTWLSSRRYALHVDTTAYAVFDFERGRRHGIEVWEVPARLEVFARPDFAGLVGALSDRFGRQPPLPDWAIEGAIIGLKDGERSFERLGAMIDAGAVVTGLWCEDWAGIRETSFGTRLFWDWRASDARYPGLGDRIEQLNGRGIRFLAYVNPYLAVDGALFVEAERAGYFARHPDRDETCLVDFGEFECGVVDFTNPEAADWFAERVIGREMLDLGIDGWMADFGEYLPTDIRLSDGRDPLLAHNAWPVLWAEVNARAVASRGKTGEAVFFMRAGYSGVGAHCPLLWAGDQSVDFSRHDGIGTVIRAALSAGLVGNAYSHSDVGGYTSLLGNVRSAELIMRWSEMAAFTPFMRSHEGNRPRDNLQLDSSPEILAHFARMTRLHAKLAPYVRILCDEAMATGLPLQRPLFLHFEEDAACYDIETQYLYGRDLLVAPVIEEGAESWRVYLPAGARWRHLWSGADHDGGDWVEVPAPLGEPPIFFRPDSDHAALFQGLTGE
ncbi:alpha-glucosidase [Parasphingopyxis algicola]|uniref:alpha-glucosidase n=1 Tax=Parasphingopyxis algicola TaxID=2026624 RepID=UPI0015A0FC0E|nr:alpha-glucosidase [Parasphingopyxis algicola]QLC25360.1 alpha-glucosidase [Parasphingopyxis algicola]